MRTDLPILVRLTLILKVWHRPARQRLGGIIPSRISAPPGLILFTVPIDHARQSDSLKPGTLSVLRIKRGVQTTFGDILWDEPFPPIYEHRDECIAAIESLRSDFDHSEEEATDGALGMTRHWLLPGAPNAISSPRDGE